MSPLSLKKLKKYWKEREMKSKKKKLFDRNDRKGERMSLLEKDW